MNWEPIETYLYNADGFGPRVLFYCVSRHGNGYMTTSSAYKYPDGRIDWSDEKIDAFTPTHWMKLPERPIYE